MTVELCTDKTCDLEIPNEITKTAQTHAISPMIDPRLALNIVVKAT
jgi:hypothetical protein